MGRGILIRDECRIHGSPPPTFRWINGLWVEFPLRAVDDTPDVTPPVTPPVGLSVDVLIRLLGRGGALSNAEIRGRLGLKDRAHLRERYRVQRCRKYD